VKEGTVYGLDAAGSLMATLTEGLTVEGWSEHTYARLDNIQSGTTPLPPNTTAWDILEKDFLELFIDYAECERGCDELKRLSVAGDYVDKYIATFEVLACHANMKLDDPVNL